MIALDLGDYSIRTLDKHNVCLFERKTVKLERFSSFGTETERRVGYYPNLKMALEAYCRLALENGDEPLTSANEIMAKINELKESILSLDIPKGIEFESELTVDNAKGEEQ